MSERCQSLPWTAPSKTLGPSVLASGNGETQRHRGHAGADSHGTRRGGMFYAEK